MLLTLLADAKTSEWFYNSQAIWLEHSWPDHSAESDPQFWSAILVDSQLTFINPHRLSALPWPACTYHGMQALHGPVFKWHCPQQLHKSCPVRVHHVMLSTLSLLWSGSIWSELGLQDWQHRTQAPSQATGIHSRVTILYRLHHGMESH